MQKITLMITYVHIITQQDQGGISQQGQNSYFKTCVSLQRCDWMVEKWKTQIHLDKHWLCPEYPGLFGPLPGLIISTYLSGRGPHPSSLTIQTFKAPRLQGYIKKKLTNGHIQHQSRTVKMPTSAPNKRILPAGGRAGEKTSVNIQAEKKRFSVIRQ